MKLIPKFQKLIKKRTWYAILASSLVFLIIFPLMLKSILIYKSPYQPADAVLVGGIGGELETAVELYKKGEVKSIIVTRGIPERYKDLESMITVQELVLKELHAKGVKEDDIHYFKQHPTSMLERQQYLRQLVYDSGIRSYITFPSIYNSGFTKMRHDHTFPEGDVEAVILPSENNLMFRKKILGIHNTIIRMVYWYLVYRPKLAIDT